MVSLSSKPQATELHTNENGLGAYAHWLNVDPTWIEAKAGCPRCGKSLKIACDEETGTLHIQKDEDSV